MSWQNEFSKFYDEQVSFLNTKSLTKHVVMRWIENNIHLIARKDAIDFAAFKEQHQMPKPLECIWEQYLDNCELNKLKHEG